MAATLMASALLCHHLMVQWLVSAIKRKLDNYFNIESFCRSVKKVFGTKSFLFIFLANQIIMKSSQS